MPIEIGQVRDWAFMGAGVLLGLVVAGHIWIDELLAWVQWVITTIIVPIIGLDQLF